ncbi:hypothetical protein [Levilactobacillus namurensis]|uniref:Uncharacterized protein n=2 Tax=Levilactobacillus TaxID=2767886 RepID=A0AAW8W596_9LACO|nr:hypothetical protein [Levilactobacillus namurensis]MDT7014672.1 hypothetical protein [Levilactobacillus namurensis]UIF29181.1 hypothetical protein KB236_11850 [Levilactobacillus brevis]
MDVMVRTNSRFTPKPVVCTNTAELDDIKSALFHKIQELAESDKLGNVDIDELYSISDKLIGWSPDLGEEEK